MRPSAIVHAVRSMKRVASALCLTLASSVAMAQSSGDLEGARKAFREALSQEAAGDWAGALTKLEEVAKLKLTAPVRYHIARCKEHLGRYTEALGEYGLAEFDAQKTDAPELAEITRAKADLAARMPRLVLVVPGELAGATIKLDGVELGGKQLSAEFPVNPGPHRLTVKQDARQWDKTFVAKESKLSRVDLSAPADEKTPGGDVPADAKLKAGEGGGAGVAPWIAAGVGVVGLAGAGVFSLMKSSAESDLDSTCRGSVCPDSMRGTKSASDRDGLLAVVSLGVGVAGLGTAAVLWLTAGSDAPAKGKETSARLRFDVAPSPGGLGFSARGAFLRAAGYRLRACRITPSDPEGTPRFAA
jgi:hypothetical protein